MTDQPMVCPVCRSHDYRELGPDEAGGLEPGEVVYQCEACGEVWA